MGRDPGRLRKKMKELIRILLPYRDKKSICFGTMASLTVMFSQSLLMIPFAFVTALLYRQIKCDKKYKE